MVTHPIRYILKKSLIFISVCKDRYTVSLPLGEKPTPETMIII
jgi:hypothetical protein